MRYLSVCSGYCAATLAWRDLGWQPAGFSEIEAFPRAVLEQRHGAVSVDWGHRHVAGSNVTPLFGDFTQIEAQHVGPIDLLVGGTPCQSFSIAGKRLGLDDPRGNLTLEFLALARRLRAPRLVWENVPGVLSHDGGRTMGTFLRLLGECGYRWAYRVLDAQFIRVDGHERAVPQRRRRVILVGYLGDGPNPASVLFERESLRGDPPPRRHAREGTAVHACESVAGSLCADSHPGAYTGQDAYTGRLIPFDTTQMTSALNRSAPKDGDPCHPLAAGAHAPAIAASLTRGAESAGKGGYAGRRQEDDVNLVAHSLRAEGFDASEDGTGRGTPIVPVYSVTQNSCPVVGENIAPSLKIGTGLGLGQPPSIASAADQWAVRRLTPTECERLQGVPDDFTNIAYRGKPAADGPRYKALGNSMAVNVMRWVGRGIVEADAARAAGPRERAA